MILLLDNYDSFTYNLLHYLEQFTDEQVDVKRNDEIEITEVTKYKAVVLSPGPGLPGDAGIMKELIKEYSKTKPILGICLGHQAIGEVFGGKLLNLENVLHGVQRNVNLLKKSNSLFKGLPGKFLSGHYHSWVLSKEGLNDEIEITAEDDHGNIMALSHKEYPVCGLQFHPESVMTDHGKTIIKNWLKFYVNR